MASEKILNDMANVLRHDVLKMTTAAGSGHPTSCMSCAEIMSALFFGWMKYDTNNAWNPDNDEFILSKGHAAPILYSSLFHAGCIKTDLMKLRKINSPLEGHPMPRSLDWIKVATGSLGQGLSVGVGFALASKLQGRKFKTYVLMGDSEISEGSVYEAMELASYYKLDNLVAIVDVNRLGQRGETMVGYDIKEYEKRFRGFGWNVVSIDGHSIKQIIFALKKTLKSKKPIAILAKTMKGKGVSFLENKEGWHGKALDKKHLGQALNELPRENLHKIKVSKPSKSKIKKARKSSVKINLSKYEIGDEVATREAYGNSLARLAMKNKNLIAIDGEVSNSTKSEAVKKVDTKKFIEAFIAEQNMAGMALGLSVKGFDVFASSFAAFLSRAHDQIRMASLSNPKHLTFCGSHSGISIGQDGASQMGLEDLSMFRSLPESKVFYPGDAVSCEKLTSLASAMNGIKYIRTTRSKTPVIYGKNEKFRGGEFKILKKSNKDKVVIAAAGITLHEALKAYEELRKKGINVSVADIYSIKPFNGNKFKNFVKSHGKKLVVVEDHYYEGGIGEMISDSVKNSGIKISHLAVKGIPHSGTPEQLLAKHGINSESIIKEARKLA